MLPDLSVVWVIFFVLVLTIVLAIIAIVMVGEIVSGWMRRLFQ